MMNLDITRMTPEEQIYSYSQSTQLEGQTGCIGHLRGDFGDGQGFYTTWEDHQAQHKTDEFKAEFDQVANALRAKDGCGLFASRSAMSKFCVQHPKAGFEGNYCTEYGFKLKTAQHTYLLRCNLNRGDYNFYLYAYVSRFLEHHMEQAKQGIRFITPDYKEIFKIADGDMIRITRSDSTHIDRPCRYIDECHIEVGGGGDNLFHICQFAEQMERCGNTVVPLRSSLPEQCYSLLLDTGKVVILKRGETGYYKTDIPILDKEDARKLVNEYNAKLGVTKAQAEAMSAGSMFGWATPAADPKNYDEQGQPIKPKHRDRDDAR